MTAIVTNNFRFHNAEQFTEAFSEASGTNMYLFIGRPIAWSDENSPDTPTDTVQQSFNHWDDMIALKRVTASDIKYVVPRYDWATGTVYTEFSHTSTALFDSEFYVITGDYNVYKCLFNNGGAASTVEPTGTSTSVLTTADGYKWKYMYTVTAGDALKFLTTDFMPVETDSTVAAAAVDGSIQIIKVTAGGSGYVTAPSVTISGDGGNCTATATITSNAVSSITVTNVGSGYRNATVSFSGGSGSNAAATAVISPIGGHGSDAVKELGGLYVMMNTRLEYADGSGDFPVAQDFRKIGIIRDPESYGTGNVATATTINATKYMNTTSASGTFIADEYLTGGTSGANARIVATSVSGSNVTIRYMQANTLSGNFTAFTSGETVTGASSGATATIGGLANPEAQPDTGEVLYVDQRKAISRASDQVESIHLVVEF